MARPKSVQVPGQSPSVSEAVQENEEQSSAQQETVTVSKATLEALMARVQALEADPVLVKRGVEQPADLPDQSRIDASKLKTPVLSKQGWVVPETYGANPNAPKGF